MNIKNLYSIFKEHSTICTNSREIKEKSIFFALKGENFNGNEYALKAINDGCSYAIIDEQDFNTHQNTILVKDVLTTLQNTTENS